MTNLVDFGLDEAAWLNYFQQQEELWIFGYGSLMWRPDFAHSAYYQGCAKGVSRNYCIISIAYRGTPESPGRVLGLIEGGECHGMAFRVTGSDLTPSFQNVWRREMISEAYRPKLIPVIMNNQGQEQHINALCFLADPDHVQYDVTTPEDQVISLIHSAVGPNGTNLDYFNDTYQQLQKMGVQDDYLTNLHQALQNKQSG